MSRKSLISLPEPVVYFSRRLPVLLSSSVSLKSPLPLYAAASHPPPSPTGWLHAEITTGRKEMKGLKEKRQNDKVKQIKMEKKKLKERERKQCRWTGLCMWVSERVCVCVCAHS